MAAYLLLIDTIPKSLMFPKTCTSKCIILNTTHTNLLSYVWNSPWYINNAQTYLVGTMWLCTYYEPLQTFIN